MDVKQYVFAFYSDSISHTTFHDESIKDDTVFSVLQNITSLLETQFPFSNIYPVLGNMDWYPKSRMTPSAGYAEFHNRLKLYGQLWSKWMPPESLGTFEKGTFFCTQSVCMYFYLWKLETHTTFPSFPTSLSLSWVFLQN